MLRERETTREREIKERERQGRTLEVGVYRERISTHTFLVSIEHFILKKRSTSYILYLTFI